LSYGSAVRRKKTFTAVGRRFVSSPLGLLSPVLSYRKKNKELKIVFKIHTYFEILVQREKLHFND
jgi:hypothetical protein